MAFHLPCVPPDPPVHIVEPQEHVFVHAITSECVLLTCKVDREEALVRWYKDGQEVVESEFVVLEHEGPQHRLLLRAAQPSDGGEFQCEAGDERAYFTVTITGGRPPWVQSKVPPNPHRTPLPAPLPSLQWIKFTTNILCSRAISWGLFHEP